MQPSAEDTVESKSPAADATGTAPATEGKKQGFVLYTDGGCMPHTGMMGWGFHGYRYEIGKPKKGSGHPSHTLTATGYHPKSEKKEEITPLDYFDAFGCHSHERGTNNQAELLAARNAFTKVMEYADTQHLLIKTDSEYLRKGLTEWSQHWVRNNWIRRDGTPVPNKELWKDILADVQTLRDNKIDLCVSWVKGHNDNFGNTLADKLATVGVVNSVQGKSFTEIKRSNVEGYWKNDVSKHPFFFNKTYFFNTLEKSHIKGEYFLGNFDKDDTLIGTRHSDGAYSIVHMKEDEAIMEMIRDYQTEMSGDFDTIVYVRMDKLYNHRTYQELVDYGRSALVRPRIDRIDLNALDKEPLTRELKPALLAWRAIESVSALKTTLANYRLDKGDDELCLTDITDVFYETLESEKKGVKTQTQKLKDSFIVGFSKLEVKAKARTKHGAIQIPVTLVLGQDIADRNALKRLETMAPKVSVLTWSDAPDVFRYVTLIESEGNYLISGGMYSNTYYHEPIKGL